MLYQGKDYKAESDYVAKLLSQDGHARKEVLEFGAGTGRHGRLLAALGFQVHGIERSREMVAAANREPAPADKPGSFDCVQGDICTTRMGREFDAVIALFHVISYQTSNRDLLLTFGNAARHLSRGGLFLFDVWHGPAVLTERPSVRVRRVEDQETLLTRIAEPELDAGAGVVTVRYTVFAESKSGETLTGFTEEHRMRYLFPTEIEFLASESGFEIELSHEFLTGKPASERTWGVLYLLRKT